MRTLCCTGQSSGPGKSRRREHEASVPVRCVVTTNNQIGGPHKGELFTQRMRWSLPEVVYGAMSEHVPCEIRTSVSDLPECFTFLGTGKWIWILSESNVAKSDAMRNQRGTVHQARGWLAAGADVLCPLICRLPHESFSC